MFYCDDCAQKRDWPSPTLMRSFGPCELCDRPTVCNDVASSRLPAPKPAPAPTSKRSRKVGDHYKVICISLYNEDLDALDQAVERLKAKGITRANRSALIRCALRKLGENEASGVDGIRRELAGPPVPEAAE